MPDAKVHYCSACGGEVLAAKAPSTCPWPRCAARGTLGTGSEARGLALARRRELAREKVRR